MARDRRPDGDHYRAELRLMSGNVVVEACDGMFERFAMTRPYAGTRVLRDEHLHRILDGARRYCDGGTLRLVYARDGEFWRIRIAVRGEWFYLVGMRVDDPAEMDELCTPSEQVRDCVGSALLLQRDGGFIVESLSPTLTARFGLRVGDDWGAFLHTHSLRFRSDEFAALSMEHERPLSFLDRFVLPEGEELVLLTLQPLPHGNIRRLAVQVKRVKEEVFYQLESSPGKAPGPCQFSPDVSYGWIERGTHTILRGSEPFDRVFLKNGNNLLMLVDSPFFRRAETGEGIGVGELCLLLGKRLRVFGCSVTPFVGGDCLVLLTPEPQREEAEALLERLTVREREIAAMVVQCAKNTEIASLLHIAEGTVKQRLSMIYEKLGISSRSELVRLLLRGVVREAEEADNAEDDVYI